MSGMWDLVKVGRVVRLSSGSVIEEYRGREEESGGRVAGSSQMLGHGDGKVAKVGVLGLGRAPVGGGAYVGECEQ